MADPIFSAHSIIAAWEREALREPPDTKAWHRELLAVINLADEHGRPDIGSLLEEADERFDPSDTEGVSMALWYGEDPFWFTVRAAADRLDQLLTAAAARASPEKKTKVKPSKLRVTWQQAEAQMKEALEKAQQRDGTVLERMLKWPAREWAEYVGCSVSTITKTTLWRSGRIGAGKRRR